MARQCIFCGADEGKKHDPSCATLVSPKTTAAKAGVDLGGNPLPVSPPGVHNIEIFIPPEVAQYAPDIRRFVDAMVYKLAAKAHKGRWENTDISKAMELMDGEVKELTEAIERGNLVEILLEAADVGNFALIVSAIAIERGK